MTITTILDLELYQMYNDSLVLGGIAHDVSGTFFQKKWGISINTYHFYLTSIWNTKIISNST